MLDKWMWVCVFAGDTEQGCARNGSECGHKVIYIYKIMYETMMQKGCDGDGSA